jgi:hypothetical protein
LLLYGSCLHKYGMWNEELLAQIVTDAYDVVL